MNDLELFNGFKNGDNKCASLFIARHRSSIDNYLRVFLKDQYETSSALDFFNDFYLNAKISKTTVNTDSDVSAYLISSAKHFAINIYRNLRRVKKKLEVYVGEINPDKNPSTDRNHRSLNEYALNPEVLFIQRQRREILKEIIEDHLPSRCGEALSLHFEGYTHAEIAEKMATTETNATSLVSFAKDKAKRTYRKHFAKR